MHDSEKIGAFFDISLESLIIKDLSKQGTGNFQVQLFSKQDKETKDLNTYLKYLKEGLLSHHPNKNYTIDEAENFITLAPNNNSIFDCSFFDFVDLIDAIGKQYITFTPTPKVDQCKIIEWRNIVQQCGEDMFICERIAKLRHSLTSKTFTWNPIIISDDRRLNLILKKGVSENHNHLMASAPIADLNWCALHNEKKFWRHLSREDYEKTHACSDSYDLFVMRMIKASVIRRYFFSLLYEKKFSSNDTFKVSFEDQLKKHSKRRMDNICKFLGIEDVALLKLKFLDDTELPNFQPIPKNNMEEYEDYTMSLLESKNPWEGERVLLYYLFKHYEDFDLKQKKLFYLYLIYRMHFYAQFVMKKSVPGFRGFLNIERYKEAFLDIKPKYKDALIQSGIKVTHDCNLQNLELRIAPKETKKENIKYVKRIMKNSIVAKSEMNEEYIRTKHSRYAIKKEEDKLYTFFPHVYIVFHFIKMGREPLIIQNGHVKNRNCMVREKVKQQAKAMSEFIQSQSKYARLVLGIDAANCEIGCRPEVFGQAFRYLRSLSHYDYFSAKLVHSLRGITYHVAEDFIDIADGLRAIYESILFLNMRAGDRLGHAIALGVNPVMYYRMKNMQIYKTKQDALDDYVWMYFILNKIGGHDDFKAEIYYEVQQLFREIFGQGFDEENITLSSYYDAMKLRGDNPKIYLNYYMSGSDKTMDIETYYKRYQSFPGYRSFGLNEQESAMRSRKNKKAVWLYYKYHHDARVRKEGEKKISIAVKETYIHAIQSLQMYVKKIIIANRLVVEVNLTSNFMIGTFQGYQDSTLFAFNRHILDPKYKDNLQVCLNTDDSGVFASNLYTEYSLLFQLLTYPENLLDSTEKYDTETAYQYIDYLRNMSNMFTFNEPDITKEQNIFQTIEKEKT